MDYTVETVKVKRPDAPGGYVVINKADLQPDDLIYENKPVKRPSKKAIPEAVETDKTP